MEGIMPVTTLSGPTVVQVPNNLAISFVAGLWSPTERLQLVGDQNSFLGGIDYEVQIEVPTNLVAVRTVTAHVSLAAISNKDRAVNAAWRIRRYNTNVNTPALGFVTI